MTSIGMSLRHCRKESRHSHAIVFVFQVTMTTEMSGMIRVVSSVVASQASYSRQLGNQIVNRHAGRSKMLTTSRLSSLILKSPHSERCSMTFSPYFAQNPDMQATVISLRQSLVLTPLAEW